MIELPAITLHQPYASLVMAGAMRFETRRLCGGHLVGRRVAIYAAMTPPLRGQVLDRMLMENGLSPLTLPLGAVIGTAEIVGSTPTEEADPSLTDRMLGNWDARRFAWRFTSPRRFPSPQAARQTGRGANVWLWSPIPQNQELAKAA